MPHATAQPIDHPACWKATDFNSKDDFSIDLSSTQINALESETASFKKSGAAHKELNPLTFPLKRYMRTCNPGVVKYNRVVVF